MLPHGDQTEIGERGINISGGQKQRLNIARAIYSDADIILMDDPLSAVDAHVGRYIFDKAILGLLKGKCVVLATHQLWVLDRCDRIVWMEAGKIQATGTFENLKNQSPSLPDPDRNNFCPKEEARRGSCKCRHRRAYPRCCHGGSQATREGPKSRAVDAARGSGQRFSTVAPVHSLCARFWDDMECASSSTTLDIVSRVQYRHESLALLVDIR